MPLAPFVSGPNLQYQRRTTYALLFPHIFTTLTSALWMKGGERELTRESSTVEWEEKSRRCELSNDVILVLFSPKGRFGELTRLNS